jgi:gluconate 2-dehydrogenase gamma chain
MVKMMPTRMAELISRRELLKRASLVGAGAMAVPSRSTVEATTTGSGAGPAQLSHGPLEVLTANEAEILEAVVARLIPTDENGPGASDARASRYIDRALGGYLETFRETYASGLTALDEFARSSRGSAFARLSPSDQDALLKVVERGDAPGFRPNSETFFALIRQHTIEGTFCDPFYGGNANFVGWDLISYPGVRTMVTAAEQEMKPVRPSHRSAYDYAQFTKASPNGTETSGMRHDK